MHFVGANNTLHGQEVEEVGGIEELEKEISRRTRSYTGS